ncbi:Uncharacterised protein [uncultured archaeon]|nr:Uncharacterised protein [uncultured archaeon]
MSKPTVGLDVDDVVAVPHTMAALLDGLDVPHKERKEMEDMKARYKKGELAAVDVHKHRHAILSNYDVEKRRDAIKSVVEAIPQENRQAVEELKKFSEVVLYSNGDYDVMNAVGESLGVKTIAVNRYLMAFAFRTHKKSEAADGLFPDVYVGDDPANEEDLFELARLKIVVERKDKHADYTRFKERGYVFVGSLPEAVPAVKKFLAETKQAQ